MKKYRVNVNGTDYDISLELMDEKEIKKETKKETSAARPAASPGSGAGNEVKSPLPGSVLKVGVTPGDFVNKGDVMFIIEAMKMENEIVSPCGGKIESVAVLAGDSVETGALLCVIN